MTSKIKTILFASLIVAMILPFSVMSMADAAVNENAYDKQNTFTDKPDIPLAPTDRGCYTYSTDEAKYLDGKSKWIEAECTSEEYMETLERPDIGASNGVYGVRDSTYDLQTYGLVDIEFDEYSGHEDSGTSDETWSLQLNTNQWYDSDWYIVQFVFQEYTGQDVACVWEIKTNVPQTYDSFCVNTNSQSLDDDYHASIEGKVLQNGNIQVQFCEIAGNTQCWVKTTGDSNDLAGNWDENSGTILGLGASSTAEFDSPTEVTTKVKTGPAQGATTLTDTSTLEENNLDYDNSSTSCAYSICTRTADASN